MAAASLVACTRAPESAPRATGSAGGTVDDDVNGVAKATAKAAKDIGQATVDLGQKAGKGLEDVTSKAGVSGQDAWITTKVKSELASDGFDPVSVHVDTDSKAVTLSGTVESATKARRAVDVAKAVKGVVAVNNHLYVKPAAP
ncbi:MAG TPA: BON domain-containing protein [Polyangia bacterium]|nr:BON domain-containing protein [Polyangia bacterium]